MTLRPRQRGELLLKAVVILVPFSLASGSHATTWIVPSDAPTIQAAISLALPSDTIEVEPGTYIGPGNRDIDFGGKNLVLRSSGGAGVTILDCQGLGRGLVFQNGEGNAAVVEGLTIANGRAAQGGAIQCIGASPTVVDCVLPANRADQSGGAVSCGFGAAPRLFRCQIENNTAFFSGGGVSCINASAEIVNCSFSGNSAGLLGGGIYCREASPTIKGSRFVDNRSDGAVGGMVFYHFSAPVIDSCIVSGNRASASAGGVFCDEQASPTFLNCVVTGNYAEFSGGAIFCTARSSATIRGSTLSGNKALQMGGGLFAEGISTFILERSILWGNCSATDGETHLADIASEASFSCSDVDSFQIGGPGAASYLADDIFVDPLFCSPQDCAVAPTGDGEYALEAASPCLPGASPCGVRIGALGACDATSVPSLFGGVTLSVFPNPSVTVTQMRYLLPENAVARLTIFDVAGRQVRAFDVQGGSGSLAWDGHDATGERTPPGIYFLRLEAGDRIETQRFTKLR